MERTVGAADDRVEIVADGGRAGEIVLSGKFVAENGVESDNGVGYFDPVSDADIRERDKSTTEAVVFKIFGIGLFLYDLDPGRLELIKDSAIAQDANAVEDDLLELRREGNGDFGFALNTGCIYNILYEVIVFGASQDVDLLVLQFIIVAVADLIGSRLAVEVGIYGDRAKQGRRRYGRWDGGTRIDKTQTKG